MGNCCKKDCMPADADIIHSIDLDNVIKRIPNLKQPSDFFIQY